MKIILMGAGKVGEVICNDLSKEKHDITLIEIQHNVLENMITEYDINGIMGNGASYDIQMEAGVDKSDIFIAVTADDELNIIASALAKSLGAKHTIARVRKSEYSAYSSIIRDSLGISYILNPEFLAAEYIRQLIAFPQANSYESFISKEAPIVEMKVRENSNLVGKMLAQFRVSYNNVIVCAVEDNHKVFIPKGNYAIKPGVNLFVTGPYRELIKLYRDNGQEDTKIKSVFVVGGGLLTNYLLKISENDKIKFKVLEINQKKAENLSENFPQVEVIHADGTILKNLKEQRVDLYDAFLALTGIDEENIIISMVAKKLPIQKILTKINRKELLEIGESVDIQTIITPKRIVADRIIQKVRAYYNAQGSNIEGLYKIANESVEVLQFNVSKDSKVIDTAIKDLNINEGNLIAYIIRNNKVLFPKGSDIIKANDKVIIVTINEKLTDLDEILK